MTKFLKKIPGKGSMHTYLIKPPPSPTVPLATETTMRETLEQAKRKLSFSEFFKDPEASSEKLKKLTDPYTLSFVGPYKPDYNRYTLSFYDEELEEVPILTFFSKTIWYSFEREINFSHIFLCKTPPKSLPCSKFFSILNFFSQKLFRNGRNFTKDTLSR